MTNNKVETQNKIRTGIVGVSGYGGGELARLLVQHPHLDLNYVTSATYAGKPLGAALPGFVGHSPLVCEVFDLQDAIDRCDLIFLAGEYGLAMKSAGPLIAAGKKVIDISADLRLKDAGAYPIWYKIEHTSPELLQKAVYGLPELHKEELKTADLVANPGCFVTSALLAISPLLSSDLIDPSTLIVDSLSGVSGAGRSKFGLDYHFSEVNESAKAYGVGGKHRHTPEIEQELSLVAGKDIRITFTPHLIPVTRGILTTVYASLKGSPRNLVDLYRERYADDPFVVILDEGSLPATKHVTGTNYCNIGITVDERTNRVIVVSALDNLVKGTAGQAIQNLNLMYGFPETTGLTMTAMWP